MVQYGLLLFIVLYSCILIGEESTGNYAYFGADKIFLVSLKVNDSICHVHTVPTYFFSSISCEFQKCRYFFKKVKKLFVSVYFYSHRRFFAGNE